MSDFLTESESLRACNLPSTSHWREWLRSKLPNQEISTGRIYQRGLVDHLAAAIRPLAGEPAPEPKRQAEPEIGFSGPVDSGVSRRTKREGPPLSNRIAGQLEHR